MPSINLETRLADRFLRATLATFYIVYHPDKDTLRSWACDFLAKVLPGLTHPLDNPHPDIFYLSRKEEEDYKMKDGELNEVFRFDRHRPVELPQKCLFLEGPHLIGESSSNKLLKTLEEPLADTSIFFLHYAQRPLLKTVTSRAIVLRLPLEGAPPHEPHDPGLGGAVDAFFQKGGGFQGALEESLTKNERKFTEHLLDRHLRHRHDGMSHYRLLKTIEHSELSRAYRNAPKGRLCLLLHNFV